MPVKPSKKIQVRYFALLREERGLGEETVKTSAASVGELYVFLQKKYGLSLKPGVLKVAVNGEFKSWESCLADGDSVVFIPPVAGG